MYDVYCELHEGSAQELNLPRYVCYSTTNPYFTDRGSWWLLIRAERTWVQDETGIRFIKNMQNPKTTPVDMTEFTMVKLKSMSV